MAEISSARRGKWRAVPRTIYRTRSDDEHCEYNDGNLFPEERFYFVHDLPRRCQTQGDRFCLVPPIARVGRISGGILIPILNASRREVFAWAGARPDGRQKISVVKINYAGNIFNYRINKLNQASGEHRTGSGPLVSPGPNR
jgi:hypothetical protein